jgi:histidinol-phosphate aminotransferase
MLEQDLISTVIRPEIRALTAYKVADATGYIKLDAMENPYTWPEEIKAEWSAQEADCILLEFCTATSLLGQGSD